MGKQDCNYQGEFDCANSYGMQRALNIFCTLEEKLLVKV